MSEQWTSEQVRRVARDFPFTSLAFRALDSFAAKLEREEDENRRDPVTDPRPGDRVEWPNGACAVYDPRNPSNWPAWEITGATIIRRREVQ